MKIIIIKKDTKHGERFYAYKSGILSRLGVYCLFNRITWIGERTKAKCIEFAKDQIRPEPKPNKRFVSEVEI